MACFSPVPLRKIESGEYRPCSKFERDLSVACNRCIGCRLRYAREWGIRIMHEASMWPCSSFVTLTYAKVPKNSSLVYEDFQVFIRALRKRLKRKVRYFVCGEYGEKFGRPHFHAAIFGEDFSTDRVYLREGLWTQKLLEEVWGLGHVSVGALELNSAKYIARYVTKKQYGLNAMKHYEKVDSVTGEVFSVLPEFAKMSLKPGIGGSFFEKFGSDIFPLDSCVVNGRELPVPRYYSKLLERQNPVMYQRVKLNREEKALQFEQSESRLAQEQEYFELLETHKKRKYEDATEDFFY